MQFQALLCDNSTETRCFQREKTPWAYKKEIFFVSNPSLIQQPAKKPYVMCGVALGLLPLVLFLLSYIAVPGPHSQRVFFNVCSPNALLFGAALKIYLAEICLCLPALIVSAILRRIEAASVQKISAGMFACMGGLLPVILLEAVFYVAFFATTVGQCSHG